MRRRTHMDESEIQSQLQQAITGSEKDIDWAWDQYRAELEEVQSNATGNLSEEMIQQHAIRCVKSGLVKGSRSGGGEVTPCEIVTIGHNGVQRWSDGDGGKKDVLIAHVIVQPDGKPRKQGVAIIDETNGADPHALKEKFDTGSAYRGHFGVSESDTMSSVYRLNWRDESRLEDVDPGDQPTDEEVEAMIHQYVTQEAEIANIANHLSLTNSDGYSVEFGADMRRLEANVVDYYDGENAQNYTLLDDSVVDPDVLGDDVVSESAPTPGLTAWCNDEQFKYGENSFCEFIGPISKDRNGQIVMNVVGVIPRIAFDLETNDYGADAETDDSVTTTEI